jgi:hypothetical protein
MDKADLNFLGFLNSSFVSNDSFLKKSKGESSQLTVNSTEHSLL